MIKYPAVQEMWVQSLGWEDPLAKEVQPSPVLLPGKCHGQRSLAGYNPWGCKRDLVIKQQQDDPQGLSKVYSVTQGLKLVGLLGGRVSFIRN